MKLLKTLRDKDFFTDVPVLEKYDERRSVRVIAFDANKNVALLYSKKMHFHAVPGGGIEEGEDTVAALKREALEEFGCKINNIRELGIIEEYRNKLSAHQISYGFVADVVGEKGTSNFEEGEIDAGFEPVWMPLETAIKTLEDEASPEDYRGKFINTRDILFLKEAEGALKIVND